MKRVIGFMAGAIILAGMTASAKEYVTIDNVNFRTGASVEASLIEGVPVDTTIEVTGMEGEWAKVEYNGNQGYMKAEYIKEKEAQGEPEKKSEEEKTEESESESESSEPKTYVNGGIAFEIPGNYKVIHELNEYDTGAGVEGYSVDEEDEKFWIVREWGPAIDYSNLDEAAIKEEMKKRLDTFVGFRDGDVVPEEADLSTADYICLKKIVEKEDRTMIDYEFYINGTIIGIGATSQEKFEKSKDILNLVDAIAKTVRVA